MLQELFNKYLMGELSLHSDREDVSSISKPWAVSVITIMLQSSGQKESHDFTVGQQIEPQSVLELSLEKKFQYFMVTSPSRNILKDQQ